MKYLQAVINAGINDENTEALNKRIILTNKIILILSIFSGFYFVLFIVLNVPYLDWLVLPIIASFLSCIFCNYMGFYQVARFGTISLPSFAILLYVSSLGVDTGIHFISYALAATALVIFMPQQKVSTLIAFLIPLAAMMALEADLIPVLIDAKLEMFYANLIRETVYIVSFLIIYLAFQFFIKANREAQESLIVANEKLQKSYEEAKKRRITMEKLSQQAAFSTLTRGIAHEIRNPMGMILTGAELILDNSTDLKSIKEYTEMVKTSIIRLKDVTNTMLKYGAPVSPRREAVDLEKCVDDTLLVSRMECRKRQILVKKVINDSRPIMADEQSVSQAIMNVLINAIQAIDQKGNIEIGLRYQSFKNKKGKRVRGMAISIKDDGPGIPNEIKEKIYDPFFSSRYENAGLGLSIVLRIVEEHQGNIRVQSSGKGSVFILYFPEKFSKSPAKNDANHNEPQAYKVPIWQPQYTPLD